MSQVIMKNVTSKILTALLISGAFFFSTAGDCGLSGDTCVVYGTPTPGQTWAQHGVSGGTDYWLHLPTNYKAKGQGPGSPIVVCFGGAGELGDMCSTGPQAGSGYPANVVCGYHDPNSATEDSSKFLRDNWIVMANPAGNIDAIAISLDNVLSTCNADPNKVFFTALCAGTPLILNLALARPNVPAYIAIFQTNLSVPGEGVVSPFSDFASLGKLKNIGIFQQATDGIDDARTLCAAFAAVGNTMMDTLGTFEGTMYGFIGGLGHDCWSCGMIGTFQYCRVQLYDFMMLHAKNGVGTSVSQHRINGNQALPGNKALRSSSRIFYGLDGRLTNMRPDKMQLLFSEPSAGVKPVVGIQK